MIIKIDLTDEQLEKLNYCVGLVDQHNPNDVLKAVLSLFDSCGEVKEKLISSQKEIKALEEKNRCMMDEQKAKHQDEVEELCSRIKFMEDNRDSIYRELDIANAKLQMVEVIFGRGAR